MSLFKKSQSMQKLRYLFDSNSSNNKTLVGIKSIKSFFSSIGLYNQLFITDLYYYYPDLSSTQKHQTFQLSFDDCLSLIEYLISKKDRNKNQELFQSFKLFDKNGNGMINSSDLLVTMKKYLSGREYEQYSQIITSSFGPTINYLEVFKLAQGKNA